MMSAAGTCGTGTGSAGTFDASAGPRARVHRRSLGTRLLALFCTLLFCGAAVSSAIASGPTAWSLALAGLALLSLCNLVTACGDQFEIGPDGIVYRNALLSRLGQRERRVGWEEVIDVREHRRLRAGRVEERPSALFLRLRSGGRLVLDSLEDLETIRLTLRRRCGSERAETRSA